jgi:hypothetical protein
LQQSLLAGFDKQLGIFDWSVLQDSVAKVQDVAYSAKRCHGFLGYAANLIRRAEKNGGVDVSLYRDAWAELFAEGAHVHAPVNA